MDCTEVSENERVFKFQSQSKVHQIGMGGSEDVSLPPRSGNVTESQRRKSIHGFYVAVLVDGLEKHLGSWDKFISHKAGWPALNLVTIFSGLRFRLIPGCRYGICTFVSFWKSNTPVLIWGPFPHRLPLSRKAWVCVCELSRLSLMRINKINITLIFLSLLLAHRSSPQLKDADSVISVDRSVKKIRSHRSEWRRYKGTVEKGYKGTYRSTRYRIRSEAMVVSALLWSR